MINIIRKGKIPFATPYSFKCPKCGCMLEATEDECTTEKLELYVTYIYKKCACPCCHTIVDTCVRKYI